MSDNGRLQLSSAPSRRYMASGLSVSNVKLASIGNARGFSSAFQGSSSVRGDSNRQSVLQERLEELLVLELRKDGGREYLRLSVRGLYKRVLSAITSPFHKTDADVSRSPRERDIDAESKQVKFTDDTKKQDGNALPDLSKEAEVQESQEVSYRERLGAYLHPRDMRRLVTPFSASNEPDVIVRRHAILLNYDPLRAIILRDRLLVIVPEGTDSLLIQLEQRVRGGSKEIENSIFGTASDFDGSSDNLNLSSHSIQGSGKQTERKSLVSRIMKKGTDMKDELSNSIGKKEQQNEAPQRPITTITEESDDDAGSVGTSAIFDNAMEWDDMQGKEWVDLPFELQCMDACLHIVTDLLSEETGEIQEATVAYIEELLHGKASGGKSEDPLLAIRHIKDAITEMKGRINSFVQSMNRILDDDEYMALCNLQRLITQPDRFIQPVSPEILEEEADEPELVFEAHLQAGFTLQNALNLIEGQIGTASEFLDQNQDAIRNKILFANMVISTFSLSVASASFVGSLFGMNVINSFETDENIFRQICVCSVAGAMCLTLVIMSILVYTGTIPKTRLAGGA